jgi:hypothetical protein
MTMAPQPPVDKRPRQNINPFDSPDILRAFRRRKAADDAQDRRQKAQAALRAETRLRVSRWRRDNRRRAAELGALAKAVHDYQLSKGTSCEICGSKAASTIVAGKIELKPLRVQWVCRSCSNLHLKPGPEWHPLAPEPGDDG